MINPILDVISHRQRTRRNGSWGSSHANLIRVPVRLHNTPDRSFNKLGFRVVRNK